MLIDSLKTVENALFNHQIALYQLTNCKDKSIFEERCKAAETARNSLIIEISNLLAEIARELKEL